MVFLDKRGRFLSQVQLAAIFSQSKNRGVSERQLNKTNITSLNDEIREEQKKGEKDYKVALEKAITKVFKVPSEKVVTQDINVEREIILRKQKERENERENLRVQKLLMKNDFGRTGRVNLTKEESDRSIIARKNALLSGRFQAGKKPIPEPKSETKRKISDAAIRKLIDEQKETARKQKVLIQMGNLRDERAVILQKGLEQPTTTVTISEPAGPPLTTPGIVAGVVPLRESTIKEKIRRRALDLEVISGLSPQLAMDQAKKEIVRQQLG